MVSYLIRVNNRINAWLLAPEANAAGRMGLFRIVFSLFYLWHLSSVYSTALSGMPERFARKEVWLVGWLSLSELPVGFFHTLEMILVAGLVVLLFGWYTRALTAVVLVAGCVLEALFVTTDFEHSTIILTFVIPFTMLVFGDWGATYSLDAEYYRRAGKASVDVASSSPRFVLPMHVTLAIVIALFVSSGVFKILPGASWHDRDALFAYLVLDKNIQASLRDLPLNPLAIFIAQTPGVELSIRWFVMLFEILFFLAFLHRRLLVFVIWLALLFHSMNAIWLVVTFTPILVFYGLFVDWEAIRRRMYPGPVTILYKIPRVWLIAAMLVIAIVVAQSWNAGSFTRSAFSLGGWVNWHTVWYPIFPVAVFMFARSVLDLAKIRVRKPQS